MHRADFSWTDYEGVLFDLDGVITPTAEIHEDAWAELFAAYDFTQNDYLRYVDGKPRYDGVRDFLRARKVDLPEGVPEDLPRAQTVHGLGNRKDELVNRVIATEGVRVFPGSVPLLERLRAAGIKTAVVTSSQNRARVIEAAGLGALFDAAVDGLTIVARGLAGKPAPDMFLEAARALGVAPARAVVLEDAISGVEAGARGNFGLVIGVARKGNADELRSHGAQLVIADLSELTA